jgi:UDP-N-acetylmuramoyl-L-alanyl-D-glutamate--2,6-diaminopimelate ligase
MVVEPSSHALQQYRIRPSKFVAVGFTNLTHEHLDFHGTMDRYFQAKSELFSKYVDKESFGIYPEDFSYKDQLKKVNKTTTLTSFSQTKQAGLFAMNIEERPELQADIYLRNTQAEQCKERLFNFKSNLVGRFNLDNILIAIGICRYLGISDEKIVQGLESAKNPE